MQRLVAGVVVLLLLLDSSVCGVDYHISVSAKMTGYVTHFWRSTGFWYVRTARPHAYTLTRQCVVGAYTRSTVQFAADLY